MEEGPLALVRAVFRRARLDIEAGNGEAADAVDFLRHPGTVDTLADMGIEPDCYWRMLGGQGLADPGVERARRMESLEVWGLSRTGIVLEVFGEVSTYRFTQVAAVLGPAKRYV